MTDPVNHPAHYTEHPSGIECIQITEHMGFNLGNAVKYIWRADLKGSAIEDLEKARWYINRELTKRDALFPATEPAEVISRYQTMQRGFAAKHFGFPANPVFEDRYTAPDGGKWQWTDELQWELRCYPPAPAEPAEEETKAEYPHRGLGDLTVLGPEIFTNGDVINWRGENFVRQPDPAASPVVPAPTETSEIRAAADALSSALVILDPLETGHWEHAWRTLNDLDDCAKREKASATAEAGGWDTWDTVPENVTVVSSFLDHRYRKVDGEVFRVLEDGKRYKVADFTPTDMRSFAPFVAAEEG